jgi:PAS domain-containing protein
MDKKPYTPPRLIAHELHDAPERMLSLFRDARTEQARTGYTTIVDKDRTYVDVSPSFCDLVGYKREELIGTRYDHLTALNTADIPATYKVFKKVGYLNGLWVLVHRTGYRILIRYEAWVRDDSLIESNIEYLQTI